MVRTDQLEAAERVLRTGSLVVYPTETVYGLGADALDSDAIERVYETKERDRTNPIALAVPDIERAREYVSPSPRALEFMRTVLPGPVTVIVEKQDRVPDALTGGRSRVGVRVPDHDVAQALLDRVHPLTATSANVSGRVSVTDPSKLDPEIRSAAKVILDDGPTPGNPSTVVDVDAQIIHRRGANVEKIEHWLERH